MKNSFQLADAESVTDLQAYLSRAKRLDEAGMVRLRAFGDVLAAYVAPIFAGSIMDSGPTILGLRTTELASVAELDSVVPIGAVLDRLAHLRLEKPGPYQIELPASERVSWTGITPPRTGWTDIGTIPEETLTEIARKGIAEVAATIPTSVGGPIAARIRGEIWGRAIDLTTQVPTGAAFVLAGLGFLTQGEEVALYHVDGWVRLTTSHGHVLAKQAQHL